MKSWCVYLALLVAMAVIYLLPSLGLGISMMLPPSGWLHEGIPLLGMVFALLALGGWSYALGLWNTWQVSRRSLAVLAAVFVVMQLWVWVMGLLKPEMTDNDSAIMQMFMLFPMWLMLLFVCVVAPVCEEILFRGVLIGKLPLANKLWGVAASCVLFAAVHMPEDAVAWSMYGGLGLAFALTYYRTKSLIPCVVLHAANNIFAVAMMPLNGL